MTSHSSSKQAGISAIIRNNAGEFVGAIAINISINSHNTAEHWAIRE